MMGVRVLIEIPDNLKEKLTKYVDGSMPEIEIKELIYKGNISIREATLIHAYQIDSAISKLECKTKYPTKGKVTIPEYITEKLRRKEYWIKSWRKFYDNGEALEALKHLQEVCDWIENKYKEEYDFNWLLDFDNFYYNKIIEKYNKGRKVKVDVDDFDE